jgi:hypothetical protein
MRKRYATLRGLYNALLFPLVGFSLTLIFAFTFINSKKIALVGKVTFPSWLNSLSLLVGLAAVAGVVAFEVVRKKKRTTDMEIGG